MQRLALKFNLMAKIGLNVLYKNLGIMLNVFLVGKNPIWS